MQLHRPIVRRPWWRLRGWFSCAWTWRCERRLTTPLRHAGPRALWSNQEAQPALPCSGLV